MWRPALPEFAKVQRNFAVWVWQRERRRRRRRKRMLSGLTAEDIVSVCHVGLDIS